MLQILTYPLVFSSNVHVLNHTNRMRLNLVTKIADFINLPDLDFISTI